MSKGKKIAAAQSAIERSPGAAELESIAADLDSLIPEAAESVRSAVHRWRCKFGALLLRARKLVPDGKPGAKQWGAFIAARDVTPSTARNWMKLAAHAGAATMESTDSAYRAIGIKRPLLTTSCAQAPAGGEPTAARLEAADFKPFKPVLWPEGSPTDEDAAADLGIKLTPELAAFGSMFESMAQTGPIRRSAAGAETIVGDAASDGEETFRKLPCADSSTPEPLPLEDQVCLLCLPWKERATAAEARFRGLSDAWDAAREDHKGALDENAALQVEVHTLRNQMQVLQLRVETERPDGVVEVDLRDGTTVELAYERDPLSRLPKPAAKTPKKSAKRKGRAVPRG